MEDAKRIIAKCLPCIRHQKVPEKEHRVIANEVNRIFDTAAMNLVFGFPETHSGYKEALAFSKNLTKYLLVFPIRTKTAEEIAQKLFIDISIFDLQKLFRQELITITLFF